jgi:hypothetical protein
LGLLEESYHEAFLVHDTKHLMAAAQNPLIQGLTLSCSYLKHATQFSHHIYRGENATRNQYPYFGIVFGIYHLVEDDVHQFYTPIKSYKTGNQI